MFCGAAHGARCPDLHCLYRHTCVLALATQEAQNLELFASAHRHLGFVTTPTVVWQLTSQRWVSQQTNKTTASTSTGMCLAGMQSTAAAMLQCCSPIADCSLCWLAVQLMVGPHSDTPTHTDTPEPVPVCLCRRRPATQSTNHDVDGGQHTWTDTAQGQNNSKQRQCIQHNKPSTPAAAALTSCTAAAAAACSHGCGS